MLPEPGTQWSHDFGESDITLASFGTSYLLCKLVRMQLWLSLDRGSVYRSAYRRGANRAIDLNTRQDELGKLYGRMRIDINGPVIKTASFSISYFPSSQ